MALLGLLLRRPTTVDRTNDAREKMPLSHVYTAMRKQQEKDEERRENVNATSCNLVTKPILIEFEEKEEQGKNMVRETMVHQICFEVWLTDMV